MSAFVRGGVEGCEGPGEGRHGAGDGRGGSGLGEGLWKTGECLFALRRKLDLENKIKMDRIWKRFACAGVGFTAGAAAGVRKRFPHFIREAMPRSPRAARGTSRLARSAPSRWNGQS